jgi:hypothetical protein
MVNDFRKTKVQLQRLLFATHWIMNGWIIGLLIGWIMDNWIIGWIIPRKVLTFGLQFSFS